MVNFHKHNPLLKNRLLAQTKSDCAEGLCSLLASLSVAEFRTAGYLLAEEILPQLTAQRYWSYFCTIVPTNSKAYLGTFLKAAAKLYKQDSLPLDKDALTYFAESATPIDKRKMLDALLPLVKQADEVQLLVSLFCNGSLETAATCLLKAATPMAYYHFFNMLRAAEVSPEQLRHYIALLVRRSDRISFNMACIIHRYFGLKDVPGNFSLRLETYELSRLEQGENYFIKVLLR